MIQDHDPGDEDREETLRRFVLSRRVPIGYPTPIPGLRTHLTPAEIRANRERINPTPRLIVLDEPEEVPVLSVERARELVAEGIADAKAYRERLRPARFGWPSWNERERNFRHGGRPR